MNKIKVLLADDHQMFIDGMKIYLEKYDHIEIVGEANNGEAVLKMLKSTPVDVVVLDIEMPEMDGIQTTKYIKKNHPKTNVLILSMYDKKEFIIKLMRYGASGYILKNKTKEELLTAINNVGAGRTHYGLEVLTAVTSLPDTGKDEEEIELTEREIEVLQKVAEGFSSKDAASELHISETTVNTHRRNIMAKLELPNAAHLVRYAIKHGYVKL